MSISGLFVMPFGVSAYNGGLLNGKKLSLVQNNSTLFTELTDNDVNTNVSIKYANAEVEYIFSSLVDITNVYMNYDISSSTEGRFKFYDQSDTLIGSIDIKDNDNDSIVPFSVTGVKKVVVSSNSAISYVNIFDIDVFGTEASVDVTPPSDVGSLSSFVGDSEVTLNYSIPSDSDFSYVNIYQDDVLIQSNVTLNTYTATGLTNDIMYTFKVTSVDFVGNESLGVTVNATPSVTSDVDPPGEVTSVQIDNVTETTVDFSWLNPVDSDFSSVNVYRDSVFLQNVVTATFSDSFLTENTTYTYQFKTVDDSGNESPGTSVNVTTAPSAPALLNSLQVIVSGDRATLTWSDGSFPVSVFLDDSVVDVNVNDRQYVFNSLNLGTNYSVKIDDGTTTLTTVFTTDSNNVLNSPLLPNSDSVFQKMVDLFGSAATYALVVIGAAVALGLITLLATYVWRLLKKWLSSSK